MTMREFHYTEGSSAKFWRISYANTQVDVQYGRIGTAGQSSSKSYANAAQAEQAAQKQIAEKLKKGYVEVGSAASAEHASDQGASVVLPASRETEAEAAPQLESARAETEPELHAGSASASQARSDQSIAKSLRMTEQTITLDPEDWFWLPYHDHAPLSRPAPAPFDQQKAFQRLQKMTDAKQAWQWDWDRVGIPAFPSAVEAHFWLMAMQIDDSSSRNRGIAPQLAQLHVDGQLSRADVERLAQNVHHRAAHYIVPLAVAILQPQGLLELLLEHAKQPALVVKSGYWQHRERLHALRKHVLPYTTAEQRQALSVQLTELLKPDDWPTDMYVAGPLAYYLAAMLGGHDQALQELISSWPDTMYTGDAWHDHYQQPQQILFGLKDPTLLISHMRRLNLNVRENFYIRAWLAHTGFSALDHIAQSILSLDNKDAQAVLIKTLARAIGPQTAPAMLELMLHSRAASVAQAWLFDHPVHTIHGLLPVAAGQTKLQAAALEILGGLARRGLAEQISTALATLPSQQAALIQKEVIDTTQSRLPPLSEAEAPELLREALTAQPYLKLAKGVSWLHPELLPDLALAGKRLDENLSFKLLQALQRSTPHSPHALILALQQLSDQTVLAQFAWAVFEQWLHAGGPSKDSWAMYGLALLGNTQTAMRLAELIRIWPGESQHRRAVLGIDVLSAMGSDAALMQINGIAQKVKFKALKEHAGDAMATIAHARGLSREELEDRIVPDCGLNQRGERLFDYGPRQFTFVLGADLKPMIRDEQGKLRADLPKANTKDEQQLADQALAEWKLLKKQIADIAKIQALRLEQAMVTGRRWSRDDFENLLMRHPLMTHLVRTLIWGAYTADNQLRQSFRVTEDLSYADQEDTGVSLAEELQIGLIHPLHLSDALKGSWGELLSDYEIVQAFPQLGRPIYKLEEAEREASEITRFNQLKIAAASLVFGLDKRGWLRDAPADGGGFSGHSKQFWAANLTAVVQYSDGVAVGYIVDAGDQKLEYIAFVPGLQTPDWWPQHKDRLPLTNVDEVVLSEVLNDIQIVMAKAV